MKVKNNLQNFFVHLLILEYLDSENMSYKQFLDLTIHKFSNGVVQSLTCTIEVQVDCCSQQDNKKIHMSSYSIGKIIFINLLKANKNIRKILINFNRFFNKTNGKNVSIKEKEHFIHLYNIGAIT